MSSIVVNGLGKGYKQYSSKWSRLCEWLLPTTKKRHQLHWVLRDISFKVAAGEAVAIVGMNGAGKSTLLKLITGTSHPTVGEVHISGRVSALLELGMGFHPEFTGRQNAVMAGQLLGMRSEDVMALMPEIEAFAEIGAYIDMPVRVYSSGMQVRLAFAVATCVRPDVLIVDEALSVGDAYFQHKSFERIREFRSLGTTLLIVSHDRNAIQSICDRAILLREGNIIKDGEPESVMDFYNALLSQQGDSSVKQIYLPDGRVQTHSGTLEAEVESLCLKNQRGEVVQEIGVGHEAILSVTVKVNQPLPRLVLGYGIKNRLGQVMYGTNTWYTKQILEDTKAGDRFHFEIRFPVNFGVGSYSVQTALVDTHSHLSANYEWKDQALVFKVVNLDQCVFDGSAWAEPQISITAL